VATKKQKKITFEDSESLQMLMDIQAQGETKKRVLLLLSTLKKPISISDIQRELEAREYIISYKSLYLGVQSLLGNGFVKLSKNSGESGQPVMVSLTPITRAVVKTYKTVMFKFDKRAHSKL